MCGQVQVGGGRAQPAVEGEPPHQRLTTGVGPVAEVDDGLAEQLQVSRRQGGDELALDLGALLRAGAQITRRDLRPGPAALLGPVHRRVRRRQQLLRVGGGATGGGDPDAGRHRDRHPVQLGGLSGRLRQPPGHPPGLAARGARQHRDELVPAHPGQVVTGTQHRPQPLRRGAEQRVACPVAEGVVDGLEPVQVQVQHGDVAAVGAGAVHLPAQLGQQQRAVQQPGQRVVGRLVEQGDLAELACGDVGVGDHGPSRASVLFLRSPQRHHRQLEPLVRLRGPARVVGAPAVGLPRQHPADATGHLHRLVPEVAAGGFADGEVVHARPAPLLVGAVGRPEPAPRAVDGEHATRGAQHRGVRGQRGQHIGEQVGAGTVHVIRRGRGGVDHPPGWLECPPSAR